MPMINVYLVGKYELFLFHSYCFSVLTKHMLLLKQFSPVVTFNDLVIQVMSGSSVCHAVCRVSIPL